MHVNHLGGSGNKDEMISAEALPGQTKGNSTEPQNRLAANALSSKKEKDAEGNSEIIQASSPITGQQLSLPHFDQPSSIAQWLRGQFTPKSCVWMEPLSRAEELG